MTEMTDEEAIRIAQEIGKQPIEQPRNIAAECAADTERLHQFRACRRMLEEARLKFEKDIERRFRDKPMASVVCGSAVIFCDVELFEAVSAAKVALLMAERAS